MARGAAVRKPRRSTRAKAAYSLEPQQDVWSDLLFEAAEDVTSGDIPERPLKKRKTALKTRSVSPVLPHPDLEPPQQRQQQVAYDDSPSDESEAEFEDVDLQHGHITDEAPSAADKAASKDISIVIGKSEASPRKRNQSTRLVTSALEKKRRLEIHKLHLCCLLAHVCVRSSWCDDANVQDSIQSLLSKRTISYLNPNTTFSQFQRSRSFMDGLQQACEAFRPAFRINARGFRRAHWITDPSPVGKLSFSDDAEPPVAKDDLVHAAQRREGSRDTGAQLFCAMLRSAGVDARLVCSLQPLSFISVPALPTPQKRKTAVYASAAESDHHHDTGDESATSVLSTKSIVSVRSAASSTTSPTIARPIKRFGHASGQQRTVDLGRAPPTPIKRIKLVESHFPVYWIEAFNVAQQRWIAVDPLVTQTIDKPQRFEPPASDSLNDMTYVIAFEDDGSAKDVTRRYTKAYNAKTRRARVESTKDGVRWWRKVLKVFRTKAKDRDQVEDAELSKKEAAEPMPRNVQDFKDHPYYALERHLRHNEVITPKREIGKLNAGKGANAVEPIYRRRDVVTVRTADKWFRSAGREVKPHQQPLKYANPFRQKRARSASPDSDNPDTEEPAGVALYGESQTSLFVPTPVINGGVPKNTFGNLDVYVPTMIPPGGAHVIAAEAAAAAKVLGIEYADAVTGFEFRGRRGTAVVKGVVVAREFAKAMEEVIRGLRWDKEQGETRKKSAEALRLWKRFLTGLKVRERIMGYAGEDKVKSEEDVQQRMDEAESEEERVVEHGGFLPDVEQQPARPTAGTGVHDYATEGKQPVRGFAALGVPDLSSGISPAEAVPILTISYSPWDFDGPLHGLYRSLRPDAVMSKVPSRMAVKQEQSSALNDQDGGGGFLPSDQGEDIDVYHTADEGGGFMAEEDNDGKDKDNGGFLVENNREEPGGGFLSAADDNDGSAGFMVDEDGNGKEIVQHEIGIDSRGHTAHQNASHSTFDPGATAEYKAEDHSAEVEQDDDEVEEEGEGIDAEDVPPSTGEEGVDVNEAEEDTTVATEDELEAQSLMSEDPEDMDAEPEWIQ